MATAGDRYQDATSNKKLWEYSECIDIEKNINKQGCYTDWRAIVWSFASVGAYDLAKDISTRGNNLYDEVAAFENLYSALK